MRHLAPGIATTAFVAVLTAWTCGLSAAQPQSIINSPHNLSISGTGPVHATQEQEICIFCHTPHNAAPVQPLWNRNLPTSAYTVYGSNSLHAHPGQPTGSSKLCLSCHDGTIAVGSVLSRGQPIAMAGGITTLSPGASNLGTDLSDDHPISFLYNPALAAANTELKSPAVLPSSVRLDANQELQCTSCHDAHDNQYGKFLVMNNSSSQLCTTCHQVGQTTVTDHLNCQTCHKTHTAPSGPYLLQQTTASETCLVCHSGAGGTAQGPNVASDLAKAGNHDTNTSVQQMHRTDTSVCTDCHQQHTMRNTTATVPQVSGRLGQINGVNLAGGPVSPAQFEYEVCFKCHAGQQSVTARVSRQIVQTDARLEFSPAAVSFHPVAAAGKSTNVPSLLPGLTTSSRNYCTDCHASDSSHKAGGSGADGPHGSMYTPVLIARYETRDNTTESASAYALCYRCHDRNRILQTSGTPFREHRKHIVSERTPCSACHDAHGIASAQGTTVHNSRLINFDVSIVQPDPVTHRLEFDATGPNRGSCYLRCHGKSHSPKSY